MSFKAGGPCGDKDLLYCTAVTDMHGTRCWNAVQHGSIKQDHLELRETAFTHLAVTFTLLHISLRNSLGNPNEPFNHLFQLTPHFIHALPLCLNISPILNFDRGAGCLRKLV